MSRVWRAWFACVVAFSAPLGAKEATPLVLASLGRAHLHWTSDKYRVQGWLMYPANFDPSKKYPLVVSVHGGPSAANFPVWPTRWNAVLPANGYFVLLPNPRGSYGEGEAFTVSGTQTVRYGSGSSWITQSVTGAGQCSNAWFGTDPLVGTVKECDVAGAPSAAST